MAHSFTNLLYHIVFATKHREPVLNATLRPHLFAYLGAAVRDLGGIALSVNGLEEHVHILAKLRPDISVSNVLQNIKTRSSGWIHRTRPQMATFGWQTGYGAFTVSQSQVDKVRRYIEQQEQHHRKQTFDIELRNILRKNGIDVDEAFFWE